MAIRNLAEHPVSFVTVRELADYWLVSQKQIRKHVAAGCLQGIRVGPRLYRITVASALALEQAFAQTAAAAAGPASLPSAPRAGLTTTADRVNDPLKS
jgi:excisionase family DNA binding protein